MTIEQMEGGDLARLLQAGNMEAFPVLVRRYQLRVYQATRQITGSHHDAEDVMQETIIQMLEKIGQWQGENFDAWLMQIARHRAIDCLRKRNHWKIELAKPYCPPDEELVQKEQKDAIAHILSKLPKVQREILYLRHFQGYSIREITMNSLSPGQLVLVHEMEKHLAEIGGISRQIQDLHEAEILHGGVQAIIAQQAFLSRYLDSPLTLPVRVRLAENLVRAGHYQEAGQFYQILLQEPSLTPHERGAYLWELAQCCRQSEQAEKGKNLLLELEQGQIYGEFHLKALKALADEDFSYACFLTARSRYQRYLESGAENAEIVRRIAWMDSHEKDNFYPLILFVQAQQQGAQGSYGLRIILDEYPDSPLAVPAFDMYLQNEQQFFSRICQRTFPGQKTPEALLPNLLEIAELEELREVAAFARYYAACLLEEMGRDVEALNTYRKLTLQTNYRLADMARKAMERLTDKISDRERSQI